MLFLELRLEIFFFFLFLHPTRPIINLLIPSMKRLTALPCLLILLLALSTGANPNPGSTPDPNATALTAAGQQALTPARVMELLEQGNREFCEDRLTVRNTVARVHASAGGQYPMAIVLSCIDSRVPVEDIFHRGLGDLFVARVAGNIVNEDVLGSMEYACKVAGAKLVLVLGHDHCGAVHSAIDSVRMGNITALLSHIQPAVQQASEGCDPQSAVSSNPDFMQRVCLLNVQLAVGEIRAKSQILSEMEREGRILIVGGLYDLHTGRVTFLDSGVI